MEEYYQCGIEDDCEDCEYLNKISDKKWTCKKTNKVVFDDNEPMDRLLYKKFRIGEFFYNRLEQKSKEVDKSINYLIIRGIEKVINDLN